jgi:hypothetical protein
LSEHLGGEIDKNLLSGAFHTGTHDDLVVALGLSCLDDPRSRQVGVSSFSLWE